CAECQPDLMIIHLGNNEVVGPFGAAGVLGPFSPSLGMIRTSLRVKATRTGQLLDRCVQGLARGSEPQSWTGMGMFVGSPGPTDDPRLNRVYSHFRTNLTDICRLGAAGGFPVIVCTIPVNLKDSAPFGSAHAAALSDERTASWENRYKAGVALEADKKCAAAIREYQEAEQIDAGYAEVAFRLGRCCAAT